jgi:hypothetical protein
MIGSKVGLYTFRPPSSWAQFYEGGKRDPNVQAQRGRHYVSVFTARQTPDSGAHGGMISVNVNPDYAVYGDPRF